jgi:hypothetical protein
MDIWSREDLANKNEHLTSVYRKCRKFWNFPQYVPLLEQFTKNVQAKFKIAQSIEMHFCMNVCGFL